MSEETALVPISADEMQLVEFEANLVAALRNVGLPHEGILVPVNQRAHAIANVVHVLSALDGDSRSRSVYISKFIAAVSSGLFDAALNYLWDETVLELRRRVSGYDLDYFYENAVKSERRRAGLSSEEDLQKITDDELIQGARQIELISDVGFRHLDYIRYMRNWASAAHPNQNELTGLQLVSWLETCINEVINLPLSSVAIEIKRLLANVKSHQMDAAEANGVSSFFNDLPGDQADRLLFGLFGLYVNPDSDTTVRDNVHHLLPRLWACSTEQAKHKVGIKHSRFVANNDNEKQRLGRLFLELVDGQAYLPPTLRAAEISRALESLAAAHRGSNNFYNEPSPARELSALVAQVGDIPDGVRRDYVLGLVEVHLTNGHGVCWQAAPIYERLIQAFSADQAIEALLSFRDERISNRLRHRACAQKFRELLQIIDVKLTSPAARQLHAGLVAATDPQLSGLYRDTRFKRDADGVEALLG